MLLYLHMRERGTSPNLTAILDAFEKSLPSIPREGVPPEEFKEYGFGFTEKDYPELKIQLPVLKESRSENF